jgi:hypothetical protein
MLLRNIRAKGGFQAAPFLGYPRLMWAAGRPGQGASALWRNPTKERRPLDFCIEWSRRHSDFAFW